MPVAKVEAQDIEIVSGERVAISNQVLQEALSLPLEILGQVHPVQLSRISFLDDGRIVVDDPEFRQAIAERLENPIEEDRGTNNAICCGGCNILCSHCA